MINTRRIRTGCLLFYLHVDTDEMDNSEGADLYIDNDEMDNL